MKTLGFCSSVLLFLVATQIDGSCLAQGARGSVLCVNSSTNRIVVRSRCKRTETLLDSRSALVGAPGATGPTGGNGSAGSDGQLRIYGNGSAGALNVTGLLSTLVSGNLQFTDCTVPAGTSLQVPSGTVLRCTGTVNIAGSILVDGGGTGGQVYSFPDTNVYTAASRSAHPGRTRTVAMNGEMGSSAQPVEGGAATYAMGDAEARLSYAIGAGGGAGGGSAGLGGAGGGYFLILAQGPITVSGSIVSSVVYPESGGGGGAGGVFVLASKTSVTVTSTASIDVSGAPGGASSIRSGAGGGGGGGAIHIISPSNTVHSPALTYAGGAPGANSTAVTAAVAISGGAGGACVGVGGQGGFIAATRPITPGAAAAGGEGVAYVLNTDPTALF